MTKLQPSKFEGVNELINGTLPPHKTTLYLSFDIYKKAGLNTEDWIFWVPLGTSYGLVFVKKVVKE